MDSIPCFFRKLVSVSFTQLPFLPLLEKVPDSNLDITLAALARITPILVPSSLASSTLSLLPANADYYILQDGVLSEEQVIAFLDNGAQKFVSKDLALLGTIPANRFILHIDTSTATCLADPTVLVGISGVLLETPTVAENLLKSFRTALKLAPADGRPKDLFVLSASREPEAVLHQPAALKLMTKTVSGTSVIPLSFLSTSIGNKHSPEPDNGKLSITTLFTSALRTDREDGLFPTIPVSVSSVSNPLGLVYSSASSISNSILSGNAVYFSRTRNALWKKGETSGAMQKVERIRMDCDADALEFHVIETGPNGEKEGFCHVPDQTSCFGGSSGLGELEATLRSRMKDAPEGSYTARLFAEPSLLKAKIMEEAGELCDAVSAEEIAAEAADLFYFTLVKCAKAGVRLRDVARILDQRDLKITRRKGDAKKEWAQKLGLKNGQEKGVNGGVGVAAVVGSTNSTEKSAPTQNGQEPLEVASEDLKCQIHDLALIDQSARNVLLQRPTMSSTDMMARVQPIIDTVRKEGDEGLRSLVVKFDRCPPAAESSYSLVLKSPFAAELMKVEPKVKTAIDQAYKNIKAFHQAQMDKEENSIVVETMPGVVCSRFARPIERVGLYVPGGTAILPSTAIMLATPAQIAKCSHISIATPPRPDGTISPEIVYIASLTGVKEIVRAGGAQAVAAMAYGTAAVSKVDKIFGPGNQFVTAAKMAVAMDTVAQTAIDMPAGPSEVLVIADQSCKPGYVASDLLSQAEHGADSQVILLAVNLSDTTIAEIEKEIKAQALALPRVEIIRKSIAHSLIIKCRDTNEAMQFSNQYAPEHLIMHLTNAREMLEKVQNAGSVFVGPYTPESCGDYASGPNHSLPTAGYAKQYSGVSTLSYLKHITSQEITQDGLRKLGPIVEVLAAAEGLDAHKNAITIRLKELSQ